MSKKKEKVASSYLSQLNVDLKNCKLLGKGHHGTVYLLPDGKVLKMCDTSKSCQNEYFILKMVSGSRFFPKAYDCFESCMVREYVGGVCLKDYLKKNQMNRTLAKNIADLLNEFINLNFSRIDIRCRDIFVDQDLSLKVIDPKGSFTHKVTYPRHLTKGLKKLKQLEPLLDVLKDEYPSLYSQWNVRMRML